MHNGKYILLESGHCGKGYTQNRNNCLTQSNNQNREPPKLYLLRSQSLLPLYPIKKKTSEVSLEPMSTLTPVACCQSWQYL